MGGQYSGCTEETTDVFIESAWFDPAIIRKSARETGIESDAKYRFERGVDPESPVDGIELATALILEYGGGDASEVTVAGEAPARRTTSRLIPPASSACWALSSLKTASRRSWCPWALA
jgi:phenylalanyl-tRNA synthetase beta chain